MRQFDVGVGDGGKRIDVFVASCYLEFTRSSLEMLFEKKCVSINQEPVKPSYKLRPGDKLTVDESLLLAEPPKVKLPILYEDEDVVVINKPAGLLTHSKGALNIEATVASFIKDKLNDQSLASNRAGIVHRLDRATSGVIITAKSSKAVSKLQKQFSQRKVKKSYLAVVEGIPEPEEALIDVPIERNPAKPQTFRVGVGGKSAQTKYRVIKTIGEGNKQYSFLELTPLTGRTHQLRVHLSYIKHPIVGDYVYGHEFPGGMLLHAASLELTLPSGDRRVFSAATPTRIKDFIG